jgi:hypothetical protein
VTAKSQPTEQINWSHGCKRKPELNSHNLERRFGGLQQTLSSVNKQKWYLASHEELPHANGGGLVALPGGTKNHEVEDQSDKSSGGHGDWHPCGYRLKE